MGSVSKVLGCRPLRRAFSQRTPGLLSSASGETRGTPGGLWRTAVAGPRVLHIGMHRQLDSGCTGRRSRGSLPVTVSRQWWPARKTCDSGSRSNFSSTGTPGCRGLVVFFQAARPGRAEKSWGGVLTAQAGLSRVGAQGGAARSASTSSGRRTRAGRLGGRDPEPQHRWPVSSVSQVSTTSLQRRPLSLCKQVGASGDQPAGQAMGAATLRLTLAVRGCWPKRRRVLSRATAFDAQLLHHGIAHLTIGWTETSARPHPCPCVE